MSCGRRLSSRVLAPQGVNVPLYIASSADDFHPTDAQVQNLVLTLSYAPMQHVQRFSTALGYVRASGRSCTPESGGGSDPAPWIRLSAASFADSINQRLNVTLLHEFGHVVDYLYRSMDGLRQRDRELYRLLSTTRHTGRTQGPSETFADCYMIFVITQLARLPYTHPADPAAYQGDQAIRRFEALLKSPAFDNWVGARSELQRPARGSA